MNNMIERKIRLSDTEEVKEFVSAAGKCDFDIDVCYNRAVIDAKSKVLNQFSVAGLFYQIIARNAVSWTQQGSDRKIRRTEHRV